jgi:CheY-like chemotaxis protein
VFHALALGLTLGLKIQDFVPRIIKADPLRFRQVLLNLLSNAVKFTFHGSIDVSCMVEPVAAPKDGSKRKEALASLMVTVRDTGVGMRQEASVRLFRMFSKIDDDRVTNNASGCGLGLAISKQLVELMGGKISVESEVDQGTAFTFNVHVALVDNLNLQDIDDGKLREDREMQEVHVANVNLMKRVLYVEDNGFAAEVLKTFMAQGGLHVEWVANGLAAVNKFKESLVHQEEEYDIILMDCQMPVMDGYEATGEIRRIEQANGLVHHPILALTAYAMPGDRQKCILAGMDQVLTKPVSKAKLLWVIAKMLTGEDGEKTSSDELGIDYESTALTMLSSMTSASQSHYASEASSSHATASISQSGNQETAFALISSQVPASGFVEAWPLVDDMKLIKLRSELKKLGEESTGTRQELVHRLKEALTRQYDAQQER